METPVQRLATLALGQDVVAWVAARRYQPTRPSFRMIAAELKAATGGEVDVTDETIRVWFAEAEASA